MNVFLQILDEGQMTDSHGREINFKNTIIIMTSNIGAKDIEVKPVGFGSETDNNVQDIIAKSLKRVFRPEFINRIDEKIFFKTLTKENISEIVSIHINKLAKRMLERGDYKLEVSSSMMDYLIKESYDEEYGARPVARAVTKHVQNPSSKAVLKGELKEGDSFIVDYNIKKDEIIIKKKNKK
jgi:ATP-dependent Clp protease ATP-binding subunit ClpC